MGLHHTKLEEMSRSAVILRIFIAKPTVAAGTNSPSTTNEKRKPKAYRDFLKREQPKPEHKAPKRYIEVGTNSMHRNKADYIPINRGSRYAPPQRIPRVDEVESRGWGRRAPQSPSSSSFGAPQGNNEIYKSDEVFSTGEARKKNQSPTPIPYKITKDISQPQFDKPTAGYSTNPQTASHK